MGLFDGSGLNLGKNYQEGRSARVASRAAAFNKFTSERSTRVAARAAARASKAQSKAEGGYWDPANVAARTDLAAGLTTAAVQAGLAAATGGASLAAGEAGGLLSSILGAAGEGLGGLGAAPPPPPPPPAPSSNTGLLALGALALGALTLR